MDHSNAEEFLLRALDRELLTERQIQEVWSAVGSRQASMEEVKRQLLRGEFMTSYQLDRLVKGERSGYFYGPYKVLYSVGAGTFARVFRAVHRQSGEIVALKVLRSRFSDPKDPHQAAQAAQFMREGKLGLTLRHPNIVPIYDVGSEGRSHYMVMEFVEGWSLRDLVRIRNKIEPLQATRLIKDMVEGLRYANEHGLTHRDLKLTNVLVTSAGQAKLVDFGLAALDEKFADGKDDDVSSARTVDYVGLERATGVRRDDTRSDIYFMGCMYYHMLSGQAPLFETRDREKRMYKQRYTNVIPIHDHDPSLSHWICTVVSKAMMLDVARRYQSPAAMLADLAIAERKLIDGDTAVSAEAAEAAMGTYVETKTHTVLVVESDPRWQEIFREGFKKVNYRVLVMSDPARALTRLYEDNKVAECVIFSAQVLGAAALKGFNSLSGDERTVAVPAVLLLDEPQKGWKAQATLAAHRIVLTMPITMKDLRSKLAGLIGR